MARRPSGKFLSTELWILLACWHVTLKKFVASTMIFRNQTHYCTQTRHDYADADRTVVVFVFLQTKAAHPACRCCCLCRAAMCSGQAVSASSFAKKIDFAKHVLGLDSWACSISRAVYATTGRVPGLFWCVCVQKLRHTGRTL